MANSKQTFIVLFASLLNCLYVQSNPTGGDLGGLKQKVYGRTTQQNDKSSDSLNSQIDAVFRPQGPTKNISEQPVTSSNTGKQDSSSPTAGPNQCNCVPYYMCEKPDIRVNDERCDSYLEVCCNDPPKNTSEPITPKPTNLRSECGHRNFNGVGFRIAGATNKEAQFGEFPWMVGLLYTESAADGTTRNIFRCGGSLIHPQLVMTAAYCVVGKKVSEIKVRAGEWDTQTKDELFPHQDHNVRQIVIHEQYKAKSEIKSYDIAVLILETPFQLAENVGLICLPDINENFDGRNCVASGWGRDSSEKGGKLPNILKKVDLPILPRDPCLTSLRNTSLGQQFNLHESYICAGGQPGNDTCQGDGGSPLVCPSVDNPSIYKQAGIVAWGIGCGKAIPAVYVNVAFFRNWLNNQISSLK